MSASDAAGRSPGPGSRTWRAAVVLFLTVFVVGLGLSGASAVWTQSGAVTAQVTTGTWVDYSRSGFSMPLAPSVNSATNCSQTQCSIRMTWKHDAKLAGTDKVTYRVEATGNDRMKVIDPTRPYQGSAPEMTLRTTRPTHERHAESVRVTITPYVNGVAGTPTVKDLWLDRTGRTWLTDAR